MSKRQNPFGFSLFRWRPTEFASFWPAAPVGCQNWMMVVTCGDALRSAPSHTGGGKSRQGDGRIVGGDVLAIVVVHLFRVEIHESARHHGVADEDIEHALVHSVTWTELGDDPPRYLLAGPDRAGNLLELVVLHVGGDEQVIHAMPLRRSTAQGLFGDE
jgi:hypothetical protein